MGILILILMVLLPLIPAFLLFKYLPQPRASVDGKVPGFTIKLGGAIAGYAALLLIVLFNNSRFTIPPNPSAFQKWTVEGTVSFDDQRGTLLYDSIYFLPPTLVIKENHFLFTLYAPAQTHLPKLYIGVDGYKSNERSLTLDARERVSKLMAVESKGP